MFLILGRTIKESLRNFWRNGWLSVASVSVLTLSLYVVSAVIVLVMIANGVLTNVEEKINVSVYFKSDVSEDRVMEIKNNLEKYQEVKEVQYISKDQALEDFKRNNANEPVIMQSLEEIGDNPLLASLIVKANDSRQYQDVVDYIDRSDFKEDVSRINYGKNKEIIDKLNNVIQQTKKVGLAVSLVFGAVAALIIFNTIRITIYVHKSEIEVMRLVGASNSFIRLPFIFEGIIYGVASSLMATILMLITAKLLDPYISQSITSGGLVGFYFGKFWFILLVQLAIGMFLGIISSVFAMRKYLKI